ncbi:MAG: hypothetical protein HY980_02770 [Candidatus Magasanikbacteria bacterium]|nr:hypothetical protein [Candidatus Magasanikbacteria bacterium]
MNQINDILNQKADDLFGDDALLGLTPTPTAPDVKKSEPEPAPNLPFNNTEQIKNAIHRVKDQLDGILRLLDVQTLKLEDNKSEASNGVILETGEKIIEGVFNGEKMVGEDGQEYAVPVNYASKSKLVEGDIMKLTITRNGSFIYKQIGPVERKRLTGELVKDADIEQYSVLADGKTRKVLTASITFFKGDPGDEVVLMVPKDGDSAWGAVENIIKKQ